MSDRAELVDLLSRYARAVDQRDMAALLDCFAEDAHVVFGGGAEVVEGRAGVGQFFAKAFAGPLLGARGASTHLMGNVLVDVAGDTAHVETQAVAYLASDDRPEVLVRGLTYSDDCVRTEQGWRIARRLHDAVWEAEMPRRPTTRPLSP